MCSSVALSASTWVILRVILLLLYALLRSFYMRQGTTVAHSACHTVSTQLTLALTTSFLEPLEPSLQYDDRPV